MMVCGRCTVHAKPWRQLAKQHILLGVVEVQSWQSRLCFRGRAFPPRFGRTPQMGPGSAWFPSRAPHAAAAYLGARRKGSRSLLRLPRRSPLRLAAGATCKRKDELGRYRQARQPRRRARVIGSQRGYTSGRGSPAREPVHCPALLHQQSRQVATNDSCAARNQRYTACGHDSPLTFNS